MVYISHNALAAMAVFFTHISSGDARVGRRFDVRQEQPDPNKQVDVVPMALDGVVAAREMDQQCVKAANPDKDELKEGYSVFVLLDCCEASGSCAAPFCNHRDACGTVPGPGKLPVPTASPTITGHVKRDEGTGRLYLVSTVVGTTKQAYEAFSLQPPLSDKKGDIISFPNVPWVSCQYLDLSDADAVVIRKNPIIAFVEPITEG